MQQEQQAQQQSQQYNNFLGDVGNQMANGQFDQQQLLQKYPQQWQAIDAVHNYYRSQQNDNVDQGLIQAKQLLDSGDQQGAINAIKSDKSISKYYSPQYIQNFTNLMNQNPQQASQLLGGAISTLNTLPQYTLQEQASRSRSGGQTSSIVGGQARSGGRQPAALSPQQQEQQQANIQNQYDSNAEYIQGIGNKINDISDILADGSGNLSRVGYMTGWSGKALPETDPGGQTSTDQSTVDAIQGVLQQPAIRQMIQQLTAAGNGHVGRILEQDVEAAKKNAANLDYGRLSSQKMYENLSRAHSILVKLHTDMLSGQKYLEQEGAVPAGQNPVQANQQQSNYVNLAPTQAYQAGQAQQINAGLNSLPAPNVVSSNPATQKQYENQFRQLQQLVQSDPQNAAENLAKFRSGWNV